MFALLLVYGVISSPRNVIKLDANSLWT